MSSNIATISKIFEHISKSNVAIHEISCDPVQHLVIASSRFFGMLDRSDPTQAEVARQLWVFRSSILFTILPFDSEQLHLNQLFNDLESAARGFAEADSCLKVMRQQLDRLLESYQNKKSSWLESVLVESSGQELPNALFYRLSGGTSPGWPEEAFKTLKNISSETVLLGSLKDFRKGIFNRIIIPSSGQTIPHNILREIIYSGRASTIDILLYSGERFVFPRRINLAETSTFKGMTQKSLIERQSYTVTSEVQIDAVDEWVNEAFWQGIHGAERSNDEAFVAANYVIFSDGTGIFLPSFGRIHVIVDFSNVSDGRCLKLVPVEELQEGDIIILRAGDSDFLLDETSDRLMTSVNKEALYEEATNWKECLDALLVTNSAADIAEEISKNGTRVTASSILQWAGTDVLGPGNSQIFKRLVLFLGKKGKILKEGSELEAYADKCWNALQDLRGLRTRAGNLIRQEMLKELARQIENGMSLSTDKANYIRIGMAGEVELLLVTVAVVDTRLSYVSPHRLCKLENLKENKWLG